ncbi:hypothetical protein ACLOJK_000833 [Asimina triloba]
MALARALMIALFFCIILTFASAMDMSIISYDDRVAKRSEKEASRLFEEWLTKHGKSYNALGEREKRFEIFKDNLRFIQEHNAGGEHSYKLGLNKFADLTNEEYRSVYLGTKTDSKLRSSRPKSGRYLYVEGEALPDSIDWREKGAVTAVKDQGSCEEWARFQRNHHAASRQKPPSWNVDDLVRMRIFFHRIRPMIILGPDPSHDNNGSGSVAAVGSAPDERSCWAFSTIAAVEGINQIVTNKLISLSEQELVDCDTSYNMGCNGGLMDYAFEFIINNGGIDTEADYPYEAYDGRCDQYRKNARVVTINSYEDVPAYDEKSLKKAVANQPVSVAVDGGGRAFQLYDSGVVTGRCGTDLDHGVTAVGYGSENGVDYWIVKNSWGASWGEKGYIRLARNINSSAGLCGIAVEPSYPIKNSPNPPNPGPSPPSPVKPPTVCDNSYTCPESNTCCCLFDYGRACFAWGCCPLESATCCDDHYSCCPQNFPVCMTDQGICLASKDNPLVGVKMLKRTPAKLNWAYSGGEKSTA